MQAFHQLLNADNHETNWQQSFVDIVDKSVDNAGYWIQVHCEQAQFGKSNQSVFWDAMDVET